MAQNNYRIRIVHSGEEFEVEGDKKFVVEMLKLYSTSKFQLAENGNLQDDEKPSKTVECSSRTTSKVLSVSEFIRQLAFKKHIDIVLAFGFFLETYSGAKDFAPADINACYYDSKLEPSNTSLMIIRNIKKGFLMSAKKSDKGDKRYLLTQSGIDYISNFILK